MSCFIYQLNAMENAGQSPYPAKAGYGEKRVAVLAYVEELEAERDEFLAALEAVELLARVNSPICHGSPIYKSIVKVIAKHSKKEEA